LGVLAVATLPLITTVMSLTVKNEDRARANLLINEEINNLRSHFPSDDQSATGTVGWDDDYDYRFSCRDIVRTSRFLSIKDGYRKSDDQKYIVYGKLLTPCPASFPGTITVSFSVYKPWVKNSVPDLIHDTHILTVETKVMVTK